MQELPPEVIAQVPKWRRCGYEPHLVRMSIDKEYLFVIRMLTREEYVELVEKLDIASFYGLSPIDGIPWPPVFFQNLGTIHLEEILRAGLLWPLSLDPDLPAAIDTLISNAIISLSGWVDPDGLMKGLDEARTYIHSLQGFLESRILSAFPNIGVDGISKLNFAQFIKLVGMSEVITGQPVDLRPWLAPEEYQREMDKAERSQKKRRQVELDRMMEGAGKNQAARKQIFDQYLTLLAQETKADLVDPTTKPDFDKHNRAIQQI